jgi:hypothetical protein
MNNETHDGDRPEAVTCSRCPRVIGPGEKYLCLDLTLEMPTEEGILVLEAHELNRLCFGCAGVVLAETAVRRKTMTPASFGQRLEKVKRRVRRGNVGE